MSQIERNTDFKIISWNEALEKVYQHNMHFEKPTRVLKIEDSLNIFIYSITNDETVVMPEYPVSVFSRNNYPAFIYYNKKVLDSAINLAQFPVPQQFITILEKEKNTLQNIDKNYNNYIAYFDSLMGTNFLSNIELSELKGIHPVIKKRKNEPYFEKLLLSYSVIISKFLINERGGVFLLAKKNQGYSPYFIPCVKIGESIINSFESIGIDELSKPFGYCFARVLLNARPVLPELKDKSTTEYFDYLKKLGYW